MSETVGTVSAATKVMEGFSPFGGEIEGFVLKPIPSAANGGLSGGSGTLVKGGVLAKASASGAELSLWPGMGVAKVSALKGLLIGKPLAGGVTVAVMGGGGGAAFLPAAMAGLSAIATLMVPVFFAGVAISAASASVGKKGKRRPGKSWLASLFPFTTSASGKPRGHRRVGQSPAKTTSSGKREETIRQAETGRDSLKKQNRDRSFEFDRRFALRIKVPPGEMIVYGMDTNGQGIKRRAIDISMHGVKFHARNTTVRSVERVVFPSYNVALIVKSARIHRQGGADAVAAIDSFENDADSWMRWIELMTRLDGKE